MTAAVLATPRDVIPPPAPDSPDADLIRLCTEYVALHREFVRLTELADSQQPPVAVDAHIRAIVDRMHAVTPTIVALPATTLDGIQAKAAFVLHHSSADADQGRPDLIHTEAEPAHSLALDLLRPRPVLALGAPAMPSLLAGLADRIEAGQRELAAMASADPHADYETGPNAAILQGWWDLTNTVPGQPITCAADVLALARICRSLWAQTPATSCDLRDALDQKLQQGVIEQFSKPDPDASLIALCAQHDALYAEANDGREYSDGEAEDNRINALMDRASQIEKTIVTMWATTPAGIVALARTTAVSADGFVVDNETTPLLKVLLRDSLALNTAHAVPTAVPGVPNAEIGTAIAAVTAAQAACDHVDATTPEDDEACYATADVLRAAIDACGSLRIASLSDASAIAALALSYIAKGDIAGQADEVVLGLLESLARYVPDTSDPGTVTVGGPSPDAELITLHNRFIALEAQVRQQFVHILDDEKRALVREPLTDEQDEIVAKVWELQATTLEGHRARARMLAAWDGELKNMATSCCVSADMTWLLVRDLLGEEHADALQSNDAAVYEQAVEAGMSGASVGLSSSPDADIIARCDQATAAQREFWQLCDEMDGLALAEEQALDKEKVQPAYNRASDLYDRIVEAPLPQTAEGLRAAARVAIFRGVDPRLSGPYKVDTTAIGSELAWKLVGHLAGLDVHPMSEAGI